MAIHRTASRTLAGLAIATCALLVTAERAAADLNCGDFPSQAAAQAHLAANPSDPDRLDANNNGQACETYNYPSSSPATTAPVTTSPVASGEQTFGSNAGTAVVEGVTTFGSNATPASSTTPQLPRTGPSDHLFPVAMAGAALLAIGGRFLTASAGRLNRQRR